MKRTSLFVCWIAGLNMACSTHPVQPIPNSILSDVVQTTLLVTVEGSKNEQLLGSPSRIFSYQGRYDRSVRAKTKLSQLSSDYNLTPLDAWPITSIGVLCQVFSISTSSQQQLLAQLRNDPRVESVQLMNRFYTNADNTTRTPDLKHKTAKRTASNTLPVRQEAKPSPVANATLSAQKDYAHLQKNLLKLNVLDAHQFSTGKDVTVAIIDTHVDRTHRDLAGRVTRQMNALVSAPVAPDNHGTAVAGIIAANAHDQHGITGIAPDANLLAITACWPMLDAAGECNSFTLARALDIAIEEQAHIINLSLSGPPDALLKRILESAIRQNIVIVGAYGSAKKSTFPTYIEGVLSVSVNPQGSAMLQLPGTEVLTTVPHDRYDFVSGNSMAAAQLSGMAALVLDVTPSLSADRLLTLFNQARIENQPIDACRLVSGLNEQWHCAQPETSTTHGSNSAPILR